MANAASDQFNFENLDFDKIAKSKQKEIYSKTFAETLSDLNKNATDFKKHMEKLNEDTSETIEPKDEEIDDFSEDPLADEEGKEGKVPLNIKLQSKCLTICTHLIAHPFKQVRLYIIELIGELSKNLVEYTNEFLPLVHKLWSTICQRFAYDDLVIKSKVIYLLFDLSVLCGDFLSSRFCKEFLPRLCAFMSEQAKMSVKASSTKSNETSEVTNPDTTYVYSHSFKLQASILGNIDKMCILFEIKEIELENLIDSIILKYLDEKQPNKLQRLALSALKNCAMIDADVVWLCLHYVIAFGKLDSQTNVGVYATSVKQKYHFRIRDDILFDLIQLFKSLWKEGLEYVIYLFFDFSK